MSVVSAMEQIKQGKGVESARQEVKLIVVNRVAKEGFT